MRCLWCPVVLFTCQKESLGGAAKRHCLGALAYFINEANRRCLALRVAETQVSVIECVLLTERNVTRLRFYDAFSVFVSWNGRVKFVFFGARGVICVGSQYVLKQGTAGAPINFPAHNLSSEFCTDCVSKKFWGKINKLERNEYSMKYDTANRLITTAMPLTGFELS